VAGAKKKCRAEGRLIVFVDESGLSERPTRVRTWAPKGQTPVIQFHFNWKQLSMIAGLTIAHCVFHAIADSHFRRSRTAFQMRPDSVSG
jgi:hypothetical protein